jgi:CDGSH-type Zn-finger protein
MAEVTITVRSPGPYLVEGDAVIRLPDGTVLQPPPAKQPGVVKLCACGRSQTRPFCDGSHRDREVGK